jgi:hypothetical protein
MVFGEGFSAEADLLNELLESGEVKKVGNSYFRGETKLGVGLANSFARIFGRQILATPEDLKKANEISSLVSNFIRNLTHLQEVEIRHQNYEEKNRHLRVRYMTKDIDEDKFKTLLQQAEKKNSKHTELQDVYRLVLTAASDILLRYHDFRITHPTSLDTTIISELDGLCVYANNCLSNIQHTYGNSVRLFTLTFVLK